ncbi:GTA baseplate fiber-binding domain-containing protein [Aurantiacibacter spongiae]|uniref:Rcc01698-like C-terminal domain-containing protein n=1 Tax=Aurantiacibacter spongiae TaxID=2488860 RepID=A0A3N5CX92_9SPHN|nr:hypothetical protein [Aurantiacibacter spongiae]RPF71269.1 hypothetical protein EG799_06340 [Aurantiacibacter spongiae]
MFGKTLGALPPSSAVLLDRLAVMEIELVAADFALRSCTSEDLAGGANRALIGEEVIQFLEAAPLGERRWRLSGLLRGRGGTEHRAVLGADARSPFVLLDDRPNALDPDIVGSAGMLAAIGLADTDPVLAPIANAGLSRTPLAPVHPRRFRLPAGGMTLAWTRRARGAWRWTDGADVPLVEDSESYEIGVGAPDRPDLGWQVSEPTLALSPATLENLRRDHSGKPLWVRQIGSFARSQPLLLLTID